MNISLEDAQWLVKHYNPIRNYGRVNDWIDFHVKAINIIKGSNEPKPSCNCMYVATAKLANSMYEQHEATIKAIVETPVIKRGRKKNGN